MWTRTYWLDLLERLLVAVAAAEFPILAASDGFNLFTIDWKTAVGVGGGAALVSLATSLLATRIGDPQSASLLRSVRAHGKHERN